jgi:hypothetical protein
MAGCYGFGDVRGCFTDDAQFLDDRTSQHLRILKRLKIQPSYEPGDVISRFYDIG